MNDYINREDMEDKAYEVSVWWCLWHTQGPCPTVQWSQALIFGWQFGTAINAARIVTT